MSAPVGGWNGRPFPRHVQRLCLPSGRVLEDAIIWRRFVQDELGLDPDEIWNELLALPTWPVAEEIPFRPLGDNPHWICGEQAALKYRGRAVKRDKIWAQSGYADGLRRYRYTGWQHAISVATHAVEHVPPVHRIVSRLNAGLIRSGHAPHNHAIVTRYSDEEDNIGMHSDKQHDFAPGSYFIVTKFGAPRPFAFRLKPRNERDNPKPFYSEILDAGTAIFVRCNAPGAANQIVQHGVPRTDEAIGISGSIVSRCIETVVPWDEVKRHVAKARGRRAGGAP